MADLIGQTIGGCTVTALIGGGGMGAVYRARQPVLDRDVAIKVIAPQFAQDPDYVARFQQEAKAAAKLNHPNIVQVYSAGQEGGFHYLIQELVEGESLQQRLDREGRVDPQEAVAVCVYVAEGLKHAWDEARLIHRDIKPANLFLSTKGAVKVGDLGLAKSLSSDASGALTQSGTTLGTPYYCSPEQARADKQIDFRADIYSLGCTLYHMLSGRKPYEGGPDQSPMSVMIRQATDPPPAILQVLPTCPPPVVSLLNTMLAKHPDARQQSYDELISELRRVHEQLGQPAAAARISSALQAEAGPKKKSPALIYGVVAAAVVAVAGVFLWAPWKVGEAVSGKRQAEPGSESRLQAEVVSVQPAKAGTPSAAPPAPESRIASSAGILAPPETRVTALTANPKVGEVATLDLGGSVTMELMGIPPGEFMLGSTKEEQAWAMADGLKEEYVKREGEGPRKTRIARGFWLGRTEVTVGQWKEFVAATGYRTEAEKKGYVDHAPRKGQVAGRVDGSSWHEPGFGPLPQDNDPVSCVSWNDAMAFCEWLTERERKAGRLPIGRAARLPTEAEWEYACRAGTQAKFWWGEAKEDGEGRLNWTEKDDGFEFKSPVNDYGERGRNKFGLADMLGNVSEWCLDEFDAKGAREECYKGNPSRRVVRGGAFSDPPFYCRCATRMSCDPAHSFGRNGFRVAVGLEPAATTTPTSASPAAAPKEGGILAPAETRVAALTTDPKVGEVCTLDLGGGVTMELMGIPPGEFLMGSTKEEQAWAIQYGAKEDYVRFEGEQPRKATIKHGYWLGRTEVSVGQWKQFVTATGYRTDAEKSGLASHAPRKGRPWGVAAGVSWKDPQFGTPPQDNHPVSCVSWNDAAAFCTWLCELERKAGRLPPGYAARLPTEVEWEYACRASTVTKFWWGDSQDDGSGRLNWLGTADGFAFVSPVDHYGSRGRNKRGLADMLGNGYEWCLDGWDATQAHEESYKDGSKGRVLRGGSFLDAFARSRCAHRYGRSAHETSCSFGFRVCIGPDVLGSAAKRPGSAGVPPAGVAEPKAKEVAKPVTTPSVASTSPPPMAVGTRALPRDDAFIKKVAGLPADQQLAAVVAKLKELNPNFDGKEAHKIEGGAVTEFGTSSVGVTDITPLKALKWLKKLSIAPATLNQKGALSDLSALQGMPLTGLWCQNNPISDLSPLRGMPLTVLSVGGTQVTELSPLAGMKLTVLSVNDTAVSDLAPLDGMPLTVLWCNNTKVTDLSRLSAMPLVELKCDFVPQRDAAILRGIKTLTKINDQPAGAFWMRVPGSAGILPASGRPASTTAAGKMPALPGTATTPPLAPTVGRAQPGQPFATSVGMELVWIPPGEFLLGSTKEERTRLGYGDITNEGDQPRKAVIKQGFWLGKTEVTVGQWKEFVSATGFQTEAEKKGRSDWAFGGQTVGASWKDPKFGSAPKDKHPVCCVSWEDAAAFCQWLEEREQKAGRLPSGYKIRLPTEAEWEYACRAGKQTAFWWGETEAAGENRCNLEGAGDGFGAVSPVDHFGARGRNRFGLADMAGNVFEWCLDAYDPAQAHEDCCKGNPRERVLRGGSFHGYPGSGRCAFRLGYRASGAPSFSGFRVAVGVER